MPQRETYSRPTLIKPKTKPQKDLWGRQFEELSTAKLKKFGKCLGLSTDLH